MAFPVQLSLSPGFDAGAHSCLQCACRGCGRVREYRDAGKKIEFRGLSGRLWLHLAELNLDGIMVAPAYNFDSVSTDVFFSREAIGEAFGPLLELRDRVSFYNTPIYLEFLAGRRELVCRPFSTSTRTVYGWKSPRCLIADRYFGTDEELMHETKWERLGSGRDPRCENC